MAEKKNRLNFGVRNTYCHPNSLLAKARHNPAMMSKILDGWREAEADARAYERWARRGFR